MASATFDNSKYISVIKTLIGKDDKLIKKLICENKQLITFLYRLGLEQMTHEVIVTFIDKLRRLTTDNHELNLIQVERLKSRLQILFDNDVFTFGEPIQIYKCSSTIDDDNPFKNPNPFSGNSLAGNIFTNCAFSDSPTQQGSVIHNVFSGNSSSSSSSIHINKNKNSPIGSGCTNIIYGSSPSKKQKTTLVEHKTFEEVSVSDITIKLRKICDMNDRECYQHVTSTSDYMYVLCGIINLDYILQYYCKELRSIFRDICNQCEDLTEEQKQKFNDIMNMILDPTNFYYYNK